MKRRLCIAAVSVVIAGAGSAQGIVIRHDRDDAAHLAMGAGFEAVGAAVPDGVCTLIAPDWVITAAHVAQVLSPFSRSIEIGSARRPVKRVVFHPTWKGRANFDSVDIALIQLAAPVEGVEPIPLYDTEDELGQVVTFVGNGDYGNGRDGPMGGDRRWRGAQNVTEEALPAWIRFVFDGPETALDAEGISGPGDSGGPAFIERDGRLYIAGVSSSNFGGDGPCRYNSNEIYARVSTAREWILGVMADPPEDMLPVRPVTDLAAGGAWPETRAAEIAQGYLAHFAAGTMLEFEKEFRSERALADRSAEARAAFWAESRAAWGELTALEVIDEGEHSIWVLLRASREARLIVMGFGIDQASGRLDGIELSRE